jgi:S-adenosylmethionine:tRNA ribosyltransferase-isomerase
MSLNIADFDFALPPERIAQHPARPRDSARLLHVTRNATADLTVRDLPDLLRPGDVMVANDTRVIPAQLTARRERASGAHADVARSDGARSDGARSDGARASGARADAAGAGAADADGAGAGGAGAGGTRVGGAGADGARAGTAGAGGAKAGGPGGVNTAARIGITLDRPRADGSWHALARNARRLRPGDVLHFDGSEGLTATVMERDPDGGVALAFNQQGEAFAAALHAAGALALPPYIARPQGPLAEDAADYQTIFAAHEGAVAAPTAGLHFTPSLLAALEARGVRRVTLTLHVGAGTFLPMRGDDIAHHRIHAERGEITPEAAAAINAAREAGGRVVAVGTTSVRLLETAVDDAGRIHPFAGDTSLFILPGFRFRAIDLLMTNFHLPRSTLFMLVCAFAGTPRMRAAYAHAIGAGYRFYSYGDACLLEPGG